MAAGTSSGSLTTSWSEPKQAITYAAARSGSWGRNWPRCDAVGDDPGDRRGQPDECPFAHPVVKGPVLRPVEDLDQVSLVGFVAHLADLRAEGQEPLDRGPARIGGDRSDPIRDALDHRRRDRVHGVVLRREVQVERALRDAGRADDVVDRGRGDTLGREDGDRRLDQLLVADFAASTATVRCWAEHGYLAKND